MTKSVAVIGAGPAGMTAAYSLAKAGFCVDVFEAGNSVGGMAKTIELWGQKVDIGPHRFFSSDKRVNELWLEVVGNDYEMVKRLTRIFYANKFYQYPLKAFDTLFKLGAIESTRCVLSYLRDCSSKQHLNGSFESWVVSRFGRRLFNIFFKTYSEKLWGISCGDLDADFAAQRIKKFSLGEAIKNALLPKSGKHKTLVDEFAYPHGGTGIVYERMADYVMLCGGAIHYKTPVKRVITNDDHVVGLELENGDVHSYDEIVSTMPLNLLVSCMYDAPGSVQEAARSLSFRNTVLVYLNVDGENLFPDNWLYVHSPELGVGRITNFRNWVPQLYGSSRRTILAMEYWCNEADALWRKVDKDIVALATIELRKTGLIGEAAVVDGLVHRIPRCYPVYERGYKKNLVPVERYLDTIKGLNVIGRYGSFKYNNQDHSILMGILAAENIASGAQHNLWEINTDYESYQEAATITRSGLQIKRISTTAAPEPAGV